MAAIIWEDIPESYDPDMSREIGTTSGRTLVILTRIGPDPDRDGELLYIDEVSASWGVVDRYVNYQLGSAERSSPSSAGWFRIEVQVPSPSKVVRPGMHLALARERAAGWAVSSAFKRHNNYGTGDLVRRLAAPAATPGDMIDRLESLEYDFWEKGHYLTAGISVPPKPMFEDARNYSRGLWVLGVCDDYSECWNTLLNSELVQQLLTWTDDGSLEFWPTHTEIPDRYKKLHPMAQSDGNWLMQVAIRQAIAGPDKECSAWIGKPVAEFVEQVYKGHIYNRNRGLVDEDARLQQVFGRLRDLHDQEERRHGRQPRPNRKRE